MRLSWHPSGVELGAWFDGEAGEGVGAHVARCARCQRKVSEFARVRAWVRAQPMVAMGDDASVATPPRRWAPVAAVAVLLVALFRLVPGDRPDTQRPSGSAREEITAAAGQAPPPAETVDPGAAPGAPGLPMDDLLAPDQGLVPSEERRAAPAAESVPIRGMVSAGSPLRLGLVVPMSGPMAREGAEVRTAVTRVVASANAAGGVAGRAVELVVAPAEDAVAVAALPHRVTVLVGGFGASPPGDPTWLLPADPSVAPTNVLAAEVGPRAAGVQLGALLLQRRLTGPVGVILGQGPDVELAAGLASRVATTTVPARPSGGCDTEIATLRRAGAMALAVAGDAGLAARCLQAATRAAWLPPFGRVVPPSAAYGHLLGVPEAVGAETVLGLPWPTSEAPGALRFRQSYDSTSYRALVSVAAAELAVDVARKKGAVTLATVGSGTWRSDLLNVTGTAGRPGTVVAAVPGAWVPSSVPTVIRPL